MSNTRFCSLNINDYPGTCYSCKHCTDYGPMSRFCSAEGKCEKDGHEIGGLLTKCINKSWYEKIN